MTPDIPTTAGLTPEQMKLARHLYSYHSMAYMDPGSFDTASNRLKAEIVEVVKLSSSERIARGFMTYVEANPGRPDPMKDGQ
jgi:hypothetical protein